MTTQTTAFPNPLAEPTMTVERYAGLIGMGRSAAYEAAKRGEIPTIKLGRRLLVPTALVARQLGIEFGTDTSSAA